eukprot:7543479-Pyramimonas_sp.AAC.1
MATTPPAAARPQRPAKADVAPSGPRVSDGAELGQARGRGSHSRQQPNLPRGVHHTAMGQGCASAPAPPPARHGRLGLTSAIRHSGAIDRGR